MRFGALKAILLLVIVSVPCFAQNDVRQSEWHGFVRYDFTFEGRDAILVVPDTLSEGKPWIWRPAFFNAFAQVDSALLHRGFHVAYYDLTHCYGSPRSMLMGKDFFDMMTSRYGLSPKVALEGFSRGGFYAFRWAAHYPEHVACIYSDAPVCDLTIWPSRENAGLWQGVLKEWDVEDEGMDMAKCQVMSVLEPIVEHRIPIITVCGGRDEVVPFESNMKPVFERLIKTGVPTELIVKPECGHHPHSLENPQPVVDFIVRNQPNFQSKHHVQMRGEMNNSYITFRDERKGCVAFLGGSITEMAGWRTMIQEGLKRRFPNTEFVFIDAGISSTGSTPGAFRLENDVLSVAMPDLLFIDAAVNDDTNYFTDEEQVRGMEGIIRHALMANPYMDIVPLYYIYDPFIKTVHQGRMPDVVLNHERVANHYKLSSVNMIPEIVGRMDAGEFDWMKFGGTHPKPFGHSYYAAAINRLFDMQWNAPEGATLKPHDIPEKPLSGFSYYGGQFVDIGHATKLKAWEIVNNWEPEDKAKQTRKGFVNVPMLCSNKRGASFTFDFIGTAVGIFCVAGYQAADLEYSLDGAPFKTLSTKTEWSSYLYIPWVYMFESELADTSHRLTVRVAKNSQGTECQIRNFVVNQLP